MLCLLLCCNFLPSNGHNLNKVWFAMLHSRGSLSGVSRRKFWNNWDRFHKLWTWMEVKFEPVDLSLGTFHSYLLQVRVNCAIFSHPARLISILFYLYSAMLEMLIQHTNDCRIRKYCLLLSNVITRSSLSWRVVTLDDIWYSCNIFCSHIRWYVVLSQPHMTGHSMEVTPWKSPGFCWEAQIYLPCNLVLGVIYFSVFDIRNYPWCEQLIRHLYEWAETFKIFK